jgi:hypothetical protein
MKQAICEAQVNNLKELIEAASDLLDEYGNLELPGIGWKDKIFLLVVEEDYDVNNRYIEIDSVDVTEE